MNSAFSPVSYPGNLGSGALPSQTFTSNVISVLTTVPADNSYMVVSYLTISSDLTVLGNLGVF